MTTCEHSPPNGSPQMEFPSMRYVGGSHVKTYRLLAGARGLKVREVAFGRRSLGLFAKLDHQSSSWRTSQGCLISGWEQFCGTWPRAGLMRNGTAYLLPLSELHIVETGCGFWPTPNKSNGFAPFSMLTMQRKELGLNRPSGCKMGFDLKWEKRAVPYLEDGWINPILSEWLMGFPIGHTDLQHSETP